MVSYENTTKKGVHRPTVRTGPGGHIGGPIGHPYFPGKFEEFLHTLLDFRDFLGNFRRIGTHTSGIFEISREFSKNWYTHFWNFRNFPEIFEELVHTLLEFSEIPGNFRRIGTHTFWPLRSGPPDPEN